MKATRNTEAVILAAVIVAAIYGLLALAGWVPMDKWVARAILVATIVTLIAVKRRPR